MTTEQDLLAEFAAFEVEATNEAIKKVDAFATKAKDAIIDGTNEIANKGINTKLKGYIIEDVTPKGYGPQ